MNKPVLVAGLGLSGIQAAGLLLKTGNEVILYDGSDKKDPMAVRDQLQEFSGGADCSEIPVVLGELPDEIISSVDTCVISPGIPLEVPFAVRLQEEDVRIISEIELAWRYEKGTVIGITGTNGKTTTTTLVGDIMREYLGPERAFTTGNIGAVCRIIRLAIFNSHPFFCFNKLSYYKLTGFCNCSKKFIFTFCIKINSCNFFIDEFIYL